MTLLRKRIECTIFCTLFLVLCYAGFCQSCQRRLAQDVVRFRVVANSDSARDQRIKLTVRDAVLNYLNAQEMHPQSAQEMLAFVRMRQEDILRVVKRTLRDCGTEQDCTIVIGESAYPTRDYGSFALPAGRYTGVQIFLQNARGHNWWCVIYPSLCIDAASAGDALSEDERGLIRTENAEYAVRFKTAEVLGELEQLLSR